MSWVKVDDRAPEHRKQIAAGPISCWLWVCGLAYCNRQSARDGFIPAPVLPMLYPIPGIAKHADKLVSVGLWERCEGGFLVHDYHDFQLAKPDAEELAAKRSAAGRRGGVKSGVVRRLQGVEANGEANGEGETKQVASSKPPLLGNPLPLPSLSLSSSDLSFPESSSSKTPAQARESAAADGERYVATTDPITPELTAVAQLAVVQDIPGAWLKFTGHYASKWIHVTGRWQAWCVREAKQERVERERARAFRQNGPVDAGDPYNDPTARRERERVRGAEYKALKSQAVAPPTSLAGLLANGPPSRQDAPGIAPTKVKPPEAVQVRQPLTEAEREAKRQAGIEALSAMNGGAK